ncbi:short-chain dehydrogenase/reductase SDR [Beutenbergia cavernae DSM 12333]|uniref:Short-chain dehydrogenase/reductase SDR n=1 Tax=Beutenbergia cavernae (strain ATCC BAA-8 / DSM 12333 / CCUG 43141 / JCM 11478 / NBRC 16432 / NCIMB 13614 / HKI 0122) TaxID=471853 RepID=C5BZN9_BEUC1|nr:SDR family oxidoreductase [Beutenbergia cavernae]ACQ81219.1 short-chain dehydrogenase/reductase SDR [Beutenbergia cavernae DSM 12333]
MSRERFAEQVVLITGAASGIGAHLAERFATEGARVALLDVDEAGATAMAQRLPDALAVGVDVSSRAAIREALDLVRERWGRLDIVVNNAATCSDTPFDRIPDHEWERDLAVDLSGPYRLVQEALPDLLRARGNVLNIVSVNGLTHFGNESYSVSKAGLMALTRSLAVTYGPQGLRANAIAPATIVTPIWDDRLERDPHVLDAATKWYPLGRLGQPDDVAHAALFLCSAEASWITGTTLVVDGGLLAGNALLADDIMAQG